MGRAKALAWMKPGIYKNLSFTSGSAWRGKIASCHYATAAHELAHQNGEVLDMPPCDFKPKPYEGPSFEEAMRIRKQNLTPALLTFYRNPVMIDQGHMQWLFDHTGRRYLDLFAGIVTVSVGHCHPKVLEATTNQMQKLWHTTNIYLHPRIHEYAERLVSTLPGNLKVAYFTNSGSEANDLAVLMSRLYTGSYEVISLRNAYHGASPYLMGLTALSSWRYNVADGFGMHQTMNPDVYRGPWGGRNCRDCVVPGTRSCDCAEGHCQASDLYAEQLADVLKHSGSKNKLAAFFAEPIQGVGGGVQLPKGYLKKAYQTVRQWGGLCVSDEVQTGFGRTGEHMWGFQAHDVIPDIVTMAKGIANGFPMGAVITTPEIANTLGAALHFNTYGGNPMSCATASAVLDVIEEDKIQQNCNEVGPYFLKELAKLQAEFEVVGDVRGKGLMISVEMVKDKESKDPLAADEMTDIWENMKDLGVLVGKGGLYGTCFRIKPPMCITEADVDFAVSVFRKSLQEHLDKTRK